MEGLRSWAASVIVAAVLAGLLEFVLPKGRFEKPVRTLIAMMMLAAFFSPFVALTAKPEQLKSGLDELLDKADAQRALTDTVKETMEREIIAAIKAFAAEENETASGFEYTSQTYGFKIACPAEPKVVVNPFENPQERGEL